MSQTLSPLNTPEHVPTETERLTTDNDETNIEFDQTKTNSGDELGVTESIRDLSPMEDEPVRTIEKEETFSTGSPGSLFSGRTDSRIGRSVFSVDLDDEILVGDEKDFHDACRRGDEDIAGNLIKSGINVDCRNKYDRTPLHWVAGNGHLSLLKLLLDEGATIDASDKFGMDGLLWSAWFGHRKCVEQMLQAGIKSSSRNKHGYQWVHCAAQNNNVNVLEILEQEMQDFDKNVVDEKGRSCLHVGCKYGRFAVVEKLIALGCDITLKDKVGNTPFHIAMKYGFHQVIPMFVDAGYDLDLTSNSHKTVLHIAAEEGFALCCQNLIDNGADVNCETDSETCPIHFSVINGHEEATKVLIACQADIDAGNKHNQTALHFAVMGSNFKLAEILINAGANPSLQDARNETVLHLASENGLAEITEILLMANSNHAAVDQKGKTPLAVAARGNYVTIVDMIIKAERHYYFTLSTNDAVKDKMKSLNFKSENTVATQQLKSLLYKLAMKHLKGTEWNQLAFYWGFTERHIHAISEQYTGSKSNKEHAHRMLLIWLHGCQERGLNPIKGLYEGLCSIHRRELAELMRAKANQTAPEKSCIIS